MTILIKIIFLLYLYITLSLWIVYINPFHLAWSTRQGTVGIRNMKGPVSLKNLCILPKVSNAVTTVNDINLHYQIRINWTSHLLLVHAVCIKNCCQIYTIFFRSICTIFSTFSLITYTGKIHLSQRYFSFQANSSFLKPLKFCWNVFLPCPFSHVIIVHPSNTPTSLTTLSMKSCFLMPLRAQPCCIHNICSP